MGCRGQLGRASLALLEAREVPGRDAGLVVIDHIVGNVELGKMDHWARWYSDVLGFKRYISFDDSQISTEYSALMSIVMSDNSYSIKFPINEPAEGRKKNVGLHYNRDQA